MTATWGAQFRECEEEALVNYRAKVEKIKADMKHNTGVDEEEMAKKGQKAGINIYAEPDTIRDDIRSTVVQQYFASKHKKHIVALKEWVPEYEQFMIKFRKAEAMDKSWKQVSGKLDPADSMVLKLKPCPRPEVPRVIPATELVVLLKDARGIQDQQDDAALLAKAKAKEAEVEGDKPTKKPPPFK